MLSMLKCHCWWTTLERNNDIIYLREYGIASAHLTGSDSGKREGWIRFKCSLASAITKTLPTTTMKQSCCFCKRRHLSIASLIPVLQLSLTARAMDWSTEERIAADVAAFGCDDWYRTIQGEKANKLFIILPYSLSEFAPKRKTHEGVDEDFFVFLKRERSCGSDASMVSIAVIL